MRIWSILLIKSDLKWCIHLSRSLFSYFKYLVSVTAGGSRSPRGHLKPSSTVDFGWFVAFESIKIFRVKIDCNCNFVGLLHVIHVHHPIWLKLDLTLLGHHFSTVWITLFGQGSLTRVQYPKCAYGPFC